jgi:hypothetical protein
MPRLVRALRVAWNLLLVFGSAALIALALGGSMQLAEAWHAEHPLRLRLLVVAAREIPAGARITPGDVFVRLDWIPEEPRPISAAGELLGRYALRSIRRGAPISRCDIGSAPSADPVGGGAIVAVSAKVADVAHLEPGMALAFVRTVEKGSDEGSTTKELEVLPSEDAARNFELIAILRSEDAEEARLLVRVPAGSRTAAELAAHEWRPFVRAAGE